MKVGNLSIAAIVHDYFWKVSTTVAYLCTDCNDKIALPFNVLNQSYYAVIWESILVWAAM